MNTRPINLDLTTVRMPLTAILSIMHRISGVLMFLGMPVLLWMLDKSLSSAEDFQMLCDLLDSTLYKLTFLAIVAAYSYHVIAGVKHLMMDHGFFESKQGGKNASRVVLVLTIILLVVLGAQL